MTCLEPASWAQYRRSAGVEEAFGIVELHQASLADLEEAGRHSAGEVAIVAHEQARHVALLELGLERFLALDVEMVGGLVEQVHVGSQQLHLEEDQPRALAVAQHADRLADPLEREAGRRKLADGVPFADAGRLDDIVEDGRIERQLAHRLVEVDQPAGRIEADRGLAVIVLALRIEGPGKRGQQSRLAAPLAPSTAIRSPAATVSRSMANSRRPSGAATSSLAMRRATRASMSASFSSSR